MRRFSGLLTRSRFSFFAVIFLIFLSLLLFYTENNIISLKKLLEKANYPSVEDFQYNLLGIAGEKNHCAHQQNQLTNRFNVDGLQQDHPCVIDTIRRQFLHQLWLTDTPLNLDHPEVVDPSAVQSKIILPLLRNQTGGFFVECGAADGEIGSNTLYMERYLNWGGILIEADRKFYDRLLTRKRKAYTLPVCLSLEPYPTTVYFREDTIAGKVMEGYNPSLAPANAANDLSSPIRGNIVSLQCFPLYSILLAVGRTKVDYFSLDVEGSETKILKTIPWHRVNVKTLTVEVTSRNMSIVEALTSYMEIQGFKKVTLLDGPDYFDLVFVHE